MACRSDVKWVEVEGRNMDWCIRALIFAVMTVTVPLFYFMFVIGGLVSYVGLWALAVQDLFYPFILVSIVDGLHLAIYGALLFFLSGVVAKKVCRQHGWDRVLRLAGVLALLFAMSLLPIFGVSHGDGEPQNAYTHLRRLK